MKHLLIIVILALIWAADPAQAATACRTPDGYAFSGKGMGGTGIDNGKGIGGTGISVDIGVYGRVTAFGSICVNGMKIDYKPSTPVNDGGGASSAQALRVGQVVAVRAYKEKGVFKARQISIQKILSGRVTQLDRKRGTMVVMKKTVLITPQHALLKNLHHGDYVMVSGLRRADGVIVASHIEKTGSVRTVHESGAQALFGSDIKYFSVQGYVRTSDKGGQVTLTDGTVVRMAASLTSLPQENDRVIISGTVDNKGNFVADRLIPEIKAFAPELTEPYGSPNGALQTPSTPDTPPQPPVDVPALPPIEAPSLPPIDVPALPPIDLPALPPVNIPDIPPVIIPDLPLLPGH